MALLSALAGAPIRQGRAITGSINQHGQVQAIGGVNEKIEGFFDVCQAAGLTGGEGVLIPASNVKHLMLRPDVVEAAEKGLFHVWPVETVDQAVELLTGLPAGERGEDGAFPEGSVNRRADDRLAEFAKKARAFGKAAANNKNHKAGPTRTPRRTRGAGVGRDRERTRHRVSGVWRGLPLGRKCHLSAHFARHIACLGRPPLRWCFGEFVLDDAARQLSLSGKPVHLTPKALELLEFLVERRPRAVSKSDLSERLWPDTHVTEANLPVLVHEVREALADDPHDPHWVRTVARFGYAFCGDARGSRPRAEDEDDVPWDCRILWGGREILLRPGENVLGRTHDAAVWIDDSSVSRRHAIVRVSPEGATLEDAESRNGTFRRGRRVDGPVSLEDGDEFVLGGVLLTFRVIPRRDSGASISHSTAPLLPPTKTPTP